MQYFTKGSDKYFASWILQDTWHTPQDIEDNFYRFIIAIHHCSKSYSTRKLKATGVLERHPRTYDKNALIDNILLAIKRNHENFDHEYAKQLVLELAEKAIIILDALWFSRLAGFPNLEIQISNPPLK